MSRKLLIVSPHFPPVNAPDHQRVRVSLPYLKEFGWEATVLAIRPSLVEGASLDPSLNKTIPSEVKVVRVPAVGVGITRRLGLGNLALRALPYLWRAGNRLLAAASFDLVFFSTTQFSVTILGPRWKGKFGLPYVVDFQDPWLDDYYKRTRTPPPGGQLKYGLSRILARWFEPQVIRDVSAVISVSPSYVETMKNRYPYLRDDQFAVLPFGAPKKDLELLSGLKVSQNIFRADDGMQHWVYLGVVGNIMTPAVNILLSALASVRRSNPSRWNKVRLHFIGTSYAPEGRSEKTVEPIAIDCGVADLVEERTGRIPYFETLQTLTEADALLIIGSDSSSYTPSKIYPYILARRPLLALLNDRSPAAKTFRDCRAGRLVTFHSKEISEQLLHSMCEALEATHEDAELGRIPDVDWQEFEQYSARAMTKKMCAVFDRVLEPTLAVARQSISNHV